MGAYDGFSHDRFRDASASLATVARAGVRVLMLTGEWDGVCTYEGTKGWIRSHEFAHECEMLHLPSDGNLTSELERKLAQARLAHVLVPHSGHMVAFDQPKMMLSTWKAFLKNESSWTCMLRLSSLEEGAKANDNVVIEFLLYAAA